MSFSVKNLRVSRKLLLVTGVVVIVISISKFKTPNDNISQWLQPDENIPRIRSLQRIVDSLPTVKRFHNTLSYGFQWIDHEPYDSVSITTSTNESFVEEKVFKFMKQLQIRCPAQIRMGRQEDGGWDVCSAGPFAIVKPCLAYSIGMGGEWSFDQMITTKYECQDMAYDPSIGKQDHKANPLLWFYNTGLGGNDTVNNQNWRIRTFPTLLEENKHSKTTIDILKMDIEYAEWESLATMLAKPSCLDNVKQLMIEFHTRELKAGSQSSIEDLVTYWHIARGIDKLGFKLWTVWNNGFCNFKSKRTPGLELCGCFNAYYVNTRLL